MSDDLDSLRSEAERLPNGTAAKVLKMTDELNSYMRAGFIRPRMVVSPPDAVIEPCRFCGAPDHNHKWHFTDTVTITISRATAESVVRDLPEASADFAFGRVALACRAALEAEQ